MPPGAERAFPALPACLGTHDAPHQTRMADKRSKSGGTSTGPGMTVQEAGRRGSAKVAAERGSKFYSEIGRKGGEAVSKNREHMATIGRKGGERRGRAGRAGGEEGSGGNSGEDGGESPTE